MIKQSFLDSLIGLYLDEALKLVKDQGLDARAYKHGTVRILVALPKTVILYHKNKLVISATAGDPFDLDKDG